MDNLPANTPLGAVAQPAGAIAPQPAAKDQIVINVGEKVDPIVKDALGEILPVLIKQLTFYLVNNAPFFGSVVLDNNFQSGRLQNIKLRPEHIFRGKAKGVAGPTELSQHNDFRQRRPA